MKKKNTIQDVATLAGVSNHRHAFDFPFTCGMPCECRFIRGAMHASIVVTIEPNGECYI